MSAGSPPGGSAGGQQFSGPTGAGSQPGQRQQSVGGGVDWGSDPGGVELVMMAAVENRAKEVWCKRPPGVGIHRHEAGEN